MKIHHIRMVCNLAKGLRSTLGEQEEICWAKLLNYDVSEGSTETEKRWAEALLFHGKATLRPKTHTELETVLSVTTEEEKEEREYCATTDGVVRGQRKSRGMKRYDRS